MIILSDSRKQYELKAALQDYIASSRSEATNEDLANLYATSVMAFAAANFWGDNVAAVPFNVIQPDGEVLPKDSDHPLAAIFYRSVFAYIQRNSMITTLFWGRNLLEIQRNFASIPKALRWINPKLWRVDARSSGGLMGFKIYPGRYHISHTHYIKPPDAVFTHELDFDDEFDGVSAAEVAFLQAGTEVEIAQTVLSFFRNNAVPAALIMPAQGQEPKPDEAAAKNLANLLRRVYKGAVNAGKAAVDWMRWEVLKLQPDFDKLALRELNQHVREMVAMAFDVPIEFFTTGQTTYAELEGKIDLWRRQRLKPRVLRSAEAYTEQLCRQFGPGWKVEPDFSEILKEDEAATFALVKDELNSTIIDLHTAQKRMKVESPPLVFKGLYIIEGIPVPLEEVPNYWRYKLVVPQLPPATESAPDTPPDTATPALPDATAEVTGKSLCAMLMLGAQPDLIVIQNHAKRLLANSPIKWNTPDDFHVTVLYAPSVTDEQAQQFVAALADVDIPDDLSLAIGSLHVFDNLGEYAVHYRIKRNALLLDLQSEMVEIAEALGIGLSAYSLPNDYKPHMTIGYSETKVPAVVYRSNLKAQPTTLRVTLDEETLMERNLDESEALKGYPPDNIFAEIKVAARKGKSFVPEALPTFTATYIGELVEYGLTQDVVIEAARKHYLGVSAAKAIQATRLDFEADFEDLLASARKEQMNRQRFGILVRALLRKYATRAYQDGLKDGGVEDELDEDDQTTLQAYLDQQSQFVTAIGDVLYKGDGISDDQAANKPVQWFNGSVYPAYVKGLESASGNAMFEWVLGKTEEHCKSCLSLRGQRHRMKAWVKSGFTPKSDRLMCGPGKLCDCGLVPAPGSKAVGRLASVPSRKSQEGEEHIHV